MDPLPVKGSVHKDVQVHPGQYTTVGMARIDDPPPYIQQQEFAHPPPLPVRPAVRPRPPPVTSNSTLTLNHSNRANPAANNLFIKTRHEPITGNFFIDPELETVALDKTGATAVDRRLYNRKHRQRHRHHGRKSFKKQPNLPDPSAIFETRHGSISLDISVVAASYASHLRTLIQAATRHGAVEINVHDIYPQRHLNMEVSTRSGDILILIPSSFSGYIQIYSRHGQLVFLPNLAQSMTLVSRHERQTQVVVGNAINCLPPQGTEWSGDTIHVASRKGNILIGYVGLDRKPEPEPGFWKKLTDMFKPEVVH